MKAWTIAICCVLGVLPSLLGQVANDDFYTTPMGSTLTVAAPGVLANDTYNGGVVATLVTGPANGTLTLNPDGSFTYKPTNNFTGVDTYVYLVKKGTQASATATVIIMVLAPGEAFYDNFARPTGTNTTIFPWAMASGAQVAGKWGITNNLMIGNGPNTNYSYAYYTNSWVNYSVQAQIRFSADNAASAGLIGRLVTASGAHYSLWVYPENSPESFASGNGTPMMYMFKYQNWTWPYTQMGSPVTLTGVGVGWHTVKLAFQGNTVSAYFDGSRVMSVTDNGTIDGNAAYTRGGIGMTLWTLPPAAYALSVDNVVVSSATNCIGNSDGFSAPTNGALRVAAPGVLANDSGGGPLTALLISGPARGNFNLTNNGGFSYTPTNGFSGADRFSYACTDGQTTSAVTTVTLTVTNSALANDDAFIAASNTTLWVAQPGVLANDQGGAAPLAVLLAGGPTDGTLTLTNNGGFSYTPANGFIGTDSFTYRCTDGQSTSAVAVVTLTVIPPLAAKNDFYSTGQGAALTVPAPGVLLNDISTNSALTASLVGSPAHGNLNWGGDGSFVYTPETNFTGLDAFTYRANSGAMTSGVATVDIMITPPGGLFYDNFARPAGSGSLFPWVQQSGAWSLTNNNLVGTSAFGSYGYLYYNNASWTDYSVQAQFRFSSTNAWGGAIGGRLNPNNGAHYAVWVYPEGSPWGPQNGIPAGVATLQIIKYETWLAYTTQSLVRLTGVGTNWHNVKLAFQGTNLFAYFDNLLVTNLTDTGSFDGQPAITNGGISLDLWTASPTAFTLSVSNVAVAPLVLNDSYSVKENTTLIVTKPGVLSNDTDIYGTNLTAALVSGPTNGTLNLSTNGGFTYTPAANFSGTDHFAVQASDKQNQLGISQVTINVIPVVAAPAPVILSIGLSNQMVTITWSSVAGATYGVQYATNLFSSIWNSLSSNVTATGPTTSESNVIGNAPRQFYRVSLPGP